MGVHTERGRVVYDRPHHKFLITDARRVVRSLDASGEVAAKPELLLPLGVAAVDLMTQYSFALMAAGTGWILDASVAESLAEMWRVVRDMFWNKLGISYDSIPSYLYESGIA